uniref:Metacaspase MCA4 n=1 Tax=Trypanosoma congolense (strain IL3000) TaxID=1068625 RepID=G0UVN2_TRYCI|nr:metacaspase MCA4 [Trypanosoma congolense IL3000]
MGECLSICCQATMETALEGHTSLVTFALSLFKHAAPYLVLYLGLQKRIGHNKDTKDPEAKEDPEEKEKEKENPLSVERSLPPPSVDRPVPSPEVNGKVRGLFVGINYVGMKAEITGCCKDVFMTMGILESKGYKFTERIILVDNDMFSNRTAAPTRANILGHLSLFVQDLKEGDVLFFHYSGHGTQVEASSDTEEKYDQCIVPSDYEEKGCITDNELFEILVKSLPRGVRLTAVFDCSHSGTMLDLPYAFVCSNPGDGNDTCSMRRIREGNDVEGDVLMISACADGETAMCVDNMQDFNGGAKHCGGAASYCFASMLMNDREMSFRELLLTARSMLGEHGFTQVPQLAASKDINLQQRFSLTGLFPCAKTLP